MAVKKIKKYHPKQIVVGEALLLSVFLNGNLHTQSETF